MRLLVKHELRRPSRALGGSGGPPPSVMVVPRRTRSIRFRGGVRVEVHSVFLTIVFHPYDAESVGIDVAVRFIQLALQEAGLPCGTKAWTMARAWSSSLQVEDRGLAHHIRVKYSRTTRLSKRVRSWVMETSWCPA